MIVQTAAFWRFPQTHLEEKTGLLVKLLVALVFVVLGFSSGSDAFNHVHGLLTGCLMGGLRLLLFKKAVEEDPGKADRLARVISLAKTGLLLLPVAHLAWLFCFYGGDEDHAAAILNMGCD